MVVSQEFVNRGKAPLLVWIEPWAEQYSVPVGCKLILKFEGLYDDPMFDASFTEHGIIFGCNWGGSTFDAMIDGEPAIPNQV